MQAFLSSQARPIARQIGAALDARGLRKRFGHVGATDPGEPSRDCPCWRCKEFFIEKAVLPEDELDAIEAIVAGIDFAGWAVLVGDIEGMLADIVRDGTVHAFMQIGLDVEARREIVNVVNAYAVEYGKQRSAELVGMRVDALGSVIPNQRAEWQITESTRSYLRADIREAIEQGLSNDTLSKKIAESYGFSKERATVISRTETIRASNAGSLESYKASGLVSATEWLTAEDDKVTPDCVLNGDAGPVALGKPFPSGAAAPPDHPNCLPGDALVAACGGIAGVVARWYDGQMIVIRTAAGHHITCTPNHPVLTDHGFLAARLLNKGDKVVSAREWMTLGDDDHKQVPASIQDVAEAFRSARQVAPLEVPCAAEYFHGDGGGSKVAVVWADCGLGVCDDAALEQRVRNLNFQMADPQAHTFYGAGTARLFLRRMYASARRLIRGAGLAFARDIVHAAPLHRLGLAGVANVSTGLFESPPNNGTSNPKRVRDGFLAGAGRVFADEVIHVNVEAFHGLVFNMETESGYYVANGIVTHNCRCTIVPVVDWTAVDNIPAITTESSP